MRFRRDFEFDIDRKEMVEFMVRANLLRIVESVCNKIVWRLNYGKPWSRDLMEVTLRVPLQSLAGDGFWGEDWELSIDLCFAFDGNKLIGARTLDCEVFVSDLEVNWKGMAFFDTSCDEMGYYQEQQEIYHLFYEELKKHDFTEKIKAGALVEVIMKESKVGDEY